MTQPWRSLQATLGLCAVVAALMTTGAWQPAVPSAPRLQEATPGAPDLVLRVLNFGAVSNDALAPTLKAEVTVWDKATGQPRLGLTPADFTATVEQTPTTAIQVTPLTTVTQNVQVVMLIDNSLTEDASLAKVKAAVGNFVDAMDPAYQLGLMTVADADQVLVPMTGDRSQVKSALAAIPRLVTKTNLHQGLADAVSLLSAQPAAPNSLQMVVAITNSGDNAKPTYPPDQVVSQAVASSVIITALNYTGTDTGKSLASITQQTGGRYYALSNADEIDAILQAILSDLQQGYEISFNAPIFGDGKEHSASLSLASAAAAPIQTQFMAPLMPLTQVVVNGPGLADGQTVSGAVHLSTAAVVPVPPITSVEYRLDGQTFATITAPPYTFQWDSTSVDPGNHRLQVIVRDSDGNSGQTEVTVLVALPFAVTASSEREQVAVGDTLIIRAQVDSPARIDHVEFLQGDGTLIFSDSSAPFECVIDTTGQAPGTRAFKVRAVDYLGRSAETNVFDIEIRPTIASTMPGIGRWVLTGLIALAILAVLLVALFGSLILSERLRRRLQSLFTLEIWNEGNVRSRYHLRADAATNALHLEFQVQGAALPVQALRASLPEAESAPQLEAAPAAAGPASKDGISISAVKETGAYRSYQKATGITAAMADFLNAMASLLPASAAGPVRGWALGLRQGERLGRGINRADATVKMVQHATSDATASLGGGSATAGSPATPALPAAPGIREAIAFGEDWALTPYVEPGEMLSVQLCARPLKSVRTQAHGIRILSRPAEMPDLAPVTEAGNITVTGLSTLQRLEPFLLAAGMLALALVLAAVLVQMWGG